MKLVWERLYHDFANGGGRTLSTGDGQGEIFGFAISVSKGVGLAKRSINMAVEIWSGLYPPVHTRLRGTKLAGKQTEMKALSELEIAQQIKVMDLIESEAHPAIENVAPRLSICRRA